MPAGPPRDGKQLRLSPARVLAIWAIACGGCLGINPAFDEPQTATGSGATGAGSTEPSSSATSVMSADAEGSTSASSGEDTVATEAVTTAASPVKVLSFGEGATDVSGVTRDTFVLSTQPSQGAGGHVDMHLAEEGPAVALLAFDITAIEVGSEVLSADLRLSTGERIFGNGTLTTGPASIYRVLEAWEEGVENESPGYANWVDRAPGEPWAAQGVGVGSREAVAMAQFAPTDPATAYTLSIPSDVVQVWVDQPQDNHGLAMTADDPMNYGWVMTSGAVDPDRRPRLTVSFQ